MTQRKINRREFLKLAIAAVGAAGLSHFRILNIGGADVARAQGDNCQYLGPSGGSTDTCDPGANDPDTCPEPGPSGDTDECFVGTPDPDFCDELFQEGDTCQGGSDPDICDEFGGGASDPDTCYDPGGTDPDVCEGTQEPDTCIPGSDPDVCNSLSLGQDICPDPPPGDGDACYPPLEPDFCYATAGEDICEGGTPDTCSPPGDQDFPNPVTISSVGAESASSALPALGGLVAALGAVALWLRRLRPEKSKEEEST